MKIFQSSIFRAVCAIVIGVLIVKFPQEGVTWLTIAIGVLFLLSGIIALIAYWQAKRHAGEYIITDKDGHTATYNGNYWNGTLTTLQPGHGYVYRRQ